MWLIMKVFVLQILVFLVFGGGIHCQASTRRLTFVVNTIYDSGLNLWFRRHGVTMPRYPWTDGPEYITQCPIQPGSKFTQKIILSTEEGTLWWHAHDDWTRATASWSYNYLSQEWNQVSFSQTRQRGPYHIRYKCCYF
ncbi:hypothetical protein AAG906_015451 [Vitis piasezkii]